MTPRRNRPLLHDRIVGFCQEAAQEHTVIGLVASGVGVALVFDCMRKMGRTGVVYLPIADVDASVELGLLWRADDPSA